MSKIKELSNLGQSIWYDYIQRTMITSGQLADLVSKGLGGVTSNPSIFEQAITGSADYDVDLNRLIAKDKSVNEIYESLAVEDIVIAADVLRTVYDTTGGKDGFVSLEVNPGLAHQTEPTIAEARRLFETVGRPNVMIKVPATRAGIPAIAALIGAGVNVNVTLIFALESYRNVAGAYIEGLEKLSRNGPTVKGGSGLAPSVRWLHFSSAGSTQQWIRHWKKSEIQSYKVRLPLPMQRWPIRSFRKYSVVIAGTGWQRQAPGCNGSYGPAPVRKIRIMRIRCMSMS